LLFPTDDEIGTRRVSLVSLDQKHCCLALTLHECVPHVPDVCRGYLVIAHNNERLSKSLHMSCCCATCDLVHAVPGDQSFISSP